MIVGIGKIVFQELGVRATARSQGGAARCHLRRGWAGRSAANIAEELVDELAAAPSDTTDVAQSISRYGTPGLGRTFGPLKANRRVTDAVPAAPDDTP